MDVEFVEVFAGVAEISRACRAQGMVGSSHDIAYSSHFDLCDRCGFLCHRLCFMEWILGPTSVCLAYRMFFVRGGLEAG